MTQALSRIVATPQAAHAAVSEGYQLAKQLLADGRRVRVTVAEDEDDITILQRGFLHAAVLPQIAEQVVVNGIRYTPQVWKEHLKDLFLPDRWDMVRLPFVQDRKTGLWKPSRKKVPVKRRKSTEGLSIKGYSDFIDKCIDHAASEWGVQFRFIAKEREAVRYVAPPRKPRQTSPQPQAETA